MGFDRYTMMAMGTLDFYLSITDGAMHNASRPFGQSRHKGAGDESVNGHCATHPRERKEVGMKSLQLDESTIMVSRIPISRW